MKRAKRGWQQRNRGDDETVRFLLSFLLVLVYRNGGELVIENLSEVSGKSLMLGMDLDADNDRVTLKVKRAVEGRA